MRVCLSVCVSAKNTIFPIHIWKRPAIYPTYNTICSVFHTLYREMTHIKIVFSQPLENYYTLSIFFTESKSHHFSWNYLNFSEIISTCLEIRVYFLYKMTMSEIGSWESTFISLGKSLLIFGNRQNMGENLPQLHRLSWILDEIDSGFLLRLRACKLSINSAQTWCHST